MVMPVADRPDGVDLKESWAVLPGIAADQFLWELAVRIQTITAALLPHSPNPHFSRPREKCAQNADPAAAGSDLGPKGIRAG
jgi:hypothetical protein